MKLTKAQKRALTLFGSTTSVPYSPGDALYVGKQNIRWDIAIKLRDMNLIEGYDLYPYGNFPVYAFCITEKGKEILEQLK